MPETPHTIFLARGLTKTYRMGEVKVPALRAVALEIYQGESLNLSQFVAAQKRVLSQFSFEAIWGMLSLRDPYAKKGRETMAVSFQGAHFPQESILTGVRWYVATR